MNKNKLFLLLPILISIVNFLARFAWQSWLFWPGASENADQLGSQHFFQVLLFDTVSTDMLFLAQMVVNIVFVIIFIFGFAQYISQDFSISGVYVFTRQQKRSKWFITRTVKLLWYSFVYTFVYLATNLIITLIGITSKTDIRSLVFIFIYNLVCFTFFVFITTFFVNIFAIHHGSNIGFLVVYLSILLCGIIIFSMLIPVKPMLESSYIPSETINVTAYIMPFIMKVVFWLNPFAHIAPNWHSMPDYVPKFETGEVFTISNAPPWQFSVGYFLVVAVIMVLCGWFSVRKKDISLEDQELI